MINFVFIHTVVTCDFINLENKIKNINHSCELRLSLLICRSSFTSSVPITLLRRQLHNKLHTNALSSTAYTFRAIHQFKWMNNTKQTRTRKIQTARRRNGNEKKLLYYVRVISASMSMKIITRSLYYSVFPLLYFRFLFFQQIRLKRCSLRKMCGNTKCILINAQMCVWVAFSE